MTEIFRFPAFGNGCRSQLSSSRFTVSFTLARIAGFAGDPVTVKRDRSTLS